MNMVGKHAVILDAMARIAENVAKRPDGHLWLIREYACALELAQMWRDRAETAEAENAQFHEEARLRFRDAR